MCDEKKKRLLPCKKKFVDENKNTSHTKQQIKKKHIERNRHKKKLNQQKKSRNVNYRHEIKKKHVKIPN